MLQRLWPNIYMLNKVIKMNELKEFIKHNKITSLVMAALLLLSAALLSITQGAVSIPVHEVFAALTNNADSESYRIIQLLRLPRTILNIFVGINLALAGCILQGILHNPLADPGIIGVSAGAGLFAMFLMIILPEYTSLVPFAAFIGALLSTGLVFLLAWERGINPLRMVLAGVAIAAFFGGGMSALSVFFSDRVQGTVVWLAGGFSNSSWSHVRIMLPYSIVGIAGAALLSRPLNAMQLGEDVARSLGIKTELVRTALVVVASLLAASAVSVAGLIGFVGLIVPHFMRLLVGSDYEVLMPCSALAGAILICLADTLSRTLFSPIEIPVGILMSFIGAPFFLYLLKRRRMN